MKLVYHSHLGAEHSLASCGLLLELDSVLRKLPLPVWRGKSPKHPQLEVVQQMLNTYLECELTARGWLSQAVIGDAEREFYADFYKAAERQWSLPGLPEALLKALCESQFGNTSRLGMDNEKFRIGHFEGRCDVGIEIVPTRALARRTDKSIATFEKCQKLLNRLGPYGMPTPVLVIGLEADDDTPVWDLKRHKVSLEAIKASTELRQALVRKHQARA